MIRRTRGDGGLCRFALVFPLLADEFLEAVAVLFPPEDVGPLPVEDAVPFAVVGVFAADARACASTRAPGTKKRMIRSPARTRVEELRNAAYLGFRL